MTHFPSNHCPVKMERNPVMGTLIPDNLRLPLISTECRRGSSVAKVLANIAELVSSQVVERWVSKTQEGWHLRSNTHGWASQGWVLYTHAQMHIRTLDTLINMHAYTLRTFKNLFVLIPKHQHFRLGSFLETHWVLFNNSVSLPAGYSLSISVL